MRRIIISASLLPDESKAAQQRYFRLDTQLDLALDDMDAVSAGNIQNLKDEAAQIVRDQAAELARLEALLK